MSSNNGNRPKLELTGLNESAVVKLLKDKPYEGENSYGPYFMFSVEHEGVEKAFFAPSELNTQISELKLGVGDIVTLKKIPIQEGKKLVSKIVLDVVARRQAQTPPPLTKQELARTNDGLMDVMRTSLREAVEITREVPGFAWQNEDVQKIASCLFIARTRTY